MVMSQKALQRKREKKKKVRQVKKISSILPTLNPLTFSKWPVYECWAPPALWELGIGHVIVSRKSSSGDIALGVYLVDTFCLGIKNCFIRLTDVSEYKELIQQISMSGGGALELVDPIYASTLIFKVKEYAMQLGFKPHVDFSKAQWMLKNIPIDETQEFVFGNEGKPCYIQGPNESQADIRRIMRTLETNSEPENYDFTLALPE